MMGRDFRPLNTRNWVMFFCSLRSDHLFDPKSQHWFHHDFNIDMGQTWGPKYRFYIWVPKFDPCQCWNHGGISVVTWGQITANPLPFAAGSSTPAELTRYRHLRELASVPSTSGVFRAGRSLVRCTSIPYTYGKLLVWPPIEEVAQGTMSHCMAVQYFLGEPDLMQLWTV